MLKIVYHSGGSLIMEAQRDSLAAWNDDDDSSRV